MYAIKTNFVEYYGLININDHKLDLNTGALNRQDIPMPLNLQLILMHKKTASSYIHVIILANCKSYRTIGMKYLKIKYLTGCKYIVCQTTMVPI